MPTLFERSLKPPFIAALRREAEREGWWRDVLDADDLVIATRGTYLNVYWQGQTLFRVQCPGGVLRVTTHEKFLLDPALKGQVELQADARFDIQALCKNGLLGRYLGLTTLKKMKTAAGVYAGDEKKGCHEIAVKNANVIDVEIAFSGEQGVEDDLLKPTSRIDLAAIEADARLVFWEAKTYANKGLRTAEAVPPVSRQIERYREIIGEHRDAIEASYTRVAENLVALEDMGWKRKLSPLIAAIGRGDIKLHLGPEPKVGLIVFGYDEGQRDNPRWQEHLDKLHKQLGKPKVAGDASAIKL